MRFFSSLYLTFNVVIISSLLIAHAPALAAQVDEYVQIVESSCKKSCVGGKDELAFCASYCQCVAKEVKGLSRKIDIVQILKKPAEKTKIVNVCSGSTAVKFFKNSCQNKCDGAPKCTAYCSCIEQKVKTNRTIAQIGDFFIGLGKNNAQNRQIMTGYEKACEK